MSSEYAIYERIIFLKYIMKKINFFYNILIFLDAFSTQLASTMFEGCVKTGK